MRLYHALCLLSLVGPTLAWVPSNVVVTTPSHDLERRRPRRTALYGFPNPFQNFGWGGKQNNNNNDGDWQNNNNSNNNDNGYNEQQQQQQQYYYENLPNRWEQSEDVNYNNDYPQDQHQYNDNCYYDDEQQQQVYNNNNNNNNNNQYNYNENNEYSDDRYNENGEYYYNEQGDYDGNRYDDYQQQEYSSAQNQYDDPRYSHYDDQEQYPQHDENRNNDYKYDGSSAMTARDDDAYSNPQDVVMGQQNYGYSNNGCGSMQAQQDYYYQRPRGPRRGGWKVTIEHGRRVRPPQMAAMNRRRRRRADPFDLSLFDDFFSFDPFDGMFSSPFDDFFPAPFSSSRRSRATRPRRQVSTSPFSSMMMDLAVPPRIVSPFSSFDRSLDQRMRSMMERSRSMMARADADPMFQRRVLEQAERYLNNDIACTTALGQPIQMGPVISQSSSLQVYMANGRETRQQENMMQVSVRGRQGGGVVRIVATESGIQNMVLQVSEQFSGYPPREINVQLSANGGPPPPGSGSSSSNNRNDGVPEIVDAEIVEHKSDSNRRMRREDWSMTPV